MFSIRHELIIDRKCSEKIWEREEKKSKIYLWKTKNCFNKPCAAYIIMTNERERAGREKETAKPKTHYSHIFLVQKKQEFC